ncbi:MAG: RNA methyltransferase [Epsilonproteobacteria bacterium]|nr:RNA methyltransferase [Campylobacterota bacterium]
MFIKIKNIDIDELSIYHKLRDNAFSADGSFIADSPKVVNILLKANLEIKSILATQEYYDEFTDLLSKYTIPKKYLATKDDMQKIVGHKIHHNCMMHGVRPKQVSLDELDAHIIMLDEISSTQNIGSIARSAMALGVGSYILPKQGPHPFGRRALRVSMGHMGMLKTHLYDDIVQTIQELQNMGYKIFAAEVKENSTPLRDVKVPKKWVLLMGHEGNGISKEILDICDEVVTIEMQEGIKSFNVSVAASIMMYRFKNL